MKIRFSHVLWLILIITLGMLVFRPRAARADVVAQSDVVARGKYLTEIAGCVTCHTPFKAEFSDFSNISPANVLKMSLSEHDALDIEGKLMAGGRPFDLGPAGVFLTRNLTPDPETGLGNWTDEQIKVAIRTGVRHDGTVLFPLMPYRLYNNMADADVTAIVTYLRTIPAVKNEIPRVDIPVPPIPERTGLTVPPASDVAATGQYLMNGVLPCTDCHTPLDNTTGAPIMSKFLAGGQPYEGPWGIVYGANLTPHKEYGLGNWTDADIRRVLSSGVRKDGRRLVLMPWQDYAKLTEADAQAVVHFLRNGLTAVDNEVPKPALNEGFEQIVELPALQTADPGPNYALIIGGIVVLLLVGGGIAFIFMRNQTKKPSA